MSDWPEHTVAELQEAGLLLVEDGNHGEYRPRPNEFGSGPTAFIRAADMDDGIVHFDTAGHIDDVALARIRKGVGRGGDILLSHKGTVGKLARVPVNAPPFVCSPQTTFWRTLDEKRLDRNFLFAYMRSPDFRDQWMSRKGETDMADYVSLTAQREFVVSLPEPDEQKAIGEVLGALDDKIELNLEMNRTLEETARAIFKSWFVDFDPVVGKSADPTMSGLTSEVGGLFPDAFVDTDAGLIPEGWLTKRLGEVVQLAYGKALPEVRRVDGSIPVYGSAGFIGWHNEPLVKGPGIIVGRKGTVGAVTWSQSDFFPIDTTYFVRVRNADLGLRYAYFMLLHAELDGISGDSAVPGLNRELAYTTRVVFPGDLRLISYFESLAEQILSMLSANEAETRMLANVRDALLPKLLSGEIRVRQAEQAVERVL